MKLSLRLRLIILFVVISSIFGAMAGFLSWQETREKIDEFFDTYQIALARQLAVADWSSVSPKIQRETDKQVNHIANAENEDEAIGFAVFDRDGHKVFHDAQNGRDFTYSPVIGSYAEQMVDGDEKWRMVWIYSADKQYVIAVGQEIEYREDIARDMAEEFIMPWLFGLGALLLMMIIVITIEFLPLGRLAKGLARRKEGDLSPLDKDNLPKEVSPLIEALNRLLAQTEKMLQRERSFISDSAHELRTPLTALKVQLEVLEMSQADEKARKESIRKLSAGIDRSERLVEQLLALSKIEAHSAEEPDDCGAIDWQHIWRQLREDYQEALENKQLNLCTEINGNGPISEGNPVLCSLLLRNLLDNAVKYSPEGAEIKMTIRDGELEILNSGTHVGEKHLPQLGQRFYRPAGQKALGSGLGLSIVKKIAEFYGCSVNFANTGDGFAVIISA